MATSSQNKKAMMAGILAVTMSIAAVFAMQSASAQTSNQNLPKCKRHFLSCADAMLHSYYFGDS